ncbi:hypothetical protein C9928_03685 [Pseudidiomarina aestuarii]|uniref:Uncharacterized protein n=1 Tax=Pseudidiomarina aestuarii TaxID=624146 RepID=A0A6N4DFZ0_9GAMM|nr:hypothetical protein C9928_03685 [Pseudidiomarina aestuarii]
MIIALCSLLSALGLYIQALKNGMGAKRWGLLGLCFGPLMVPMFVSHKRMTLIRTLGRHDVLWQCR